MKTFVVLCMLVASALAQEIYQPTPYSFNYASPSEDGGSSSHQESGDGAGRVTGSYSLNNLEGHSRTVEYIADENGFRATVSTNEPGTAPINPADVTMNSVAEGNPISYTLGLGSAAAPAGRMIAPAPYAPIPTRMVAPAPYAAPIATRMMAPAPYAAPIATRMMAPVAPRVISPAARVAPAGRSGMRYVMVPVTDPRAQGYY